MEFEKNKTKLIEIKSRMLVAREWGWGNGELLVKGYRLPVRSKSWGVTYSMVTAVNSVVYVKVAKKVGLKRARHTHRVCTHNGSCEVIDVITYCNHFAVYTCIKSLHCTP